MSETRAIKNPLVLEFERIGPYPWSQEVMLKVTDSEGNKLLIVAHAERWQALVDGPMIGESESDRARRLYVRGVTDLDAFEATLDREERMSSQMDWSVR